MNRTPTPAIPFTAIDTMSIDGNRYGFALWMPCATLFLKNARVRPPITKVMVKVATKNRDGSSGSTNRGPVEKHAQRQSAGDNASANPHPHHCPIFRIVPIRPLCPISPMPTPATPDNQSEDSPACRKTTAPVATASPSKATARPLKRRKSPIRPPRMDGKMICSPHSQDCDQSEHSQQPHPVSGYDGEKGIQHLRLEICHRADDASRHDRR